MINEEWTILKGKGEGNKFYTVEWQIKFSYEGEETIARNITTLNTPLPRSASESDLMAAVKQSVTSSELADMRRYAEDYLISNTEGVYFKSDAAMKDEVEQKRRMHLHMSDWVVVKASEKGEAVPQEWATYRQALRDITDQAGYPENVVWPAKPAQ